MLTRAFPATVPSPTMGANDMQTLFEDYMRTAEALCTHIDIENDYLFAGHGSRILKDRKATRRKALLMAFHKFTAERIGQALAAGRADVPTMREQVKINIDQVRRLLHVNQSLLMDEIKNKERRIDAIMSRIRSCSSSELERLHNDTIFHVNSEGENNVTH